MIQSTEQAEMFLQTNPNLKQIIRRAEVKLKDYFGNAPLYLDLDDEHLTLLIATESDPKAAIDSLHKFDREWWFDNQPDDLKLIVDVCSI